MIDRYAMCTISGVGHNARNLARRVVRELTSRDITCHRVNHVVVLRTAPSSCEDQNKVCLVLHNFACNLLAGLRIDANVRTIVLRPSSNLPYAK
jgi:hypothetical protein